MYSVDKVEGKGLGCIATKKIKKGTLILREKPSLVKVADVNKDMNPTVLKNLIDAYVKMEVGEKEEYLTLANKYSEDSEIGFEVEEDREEFVRAFTAYCDQIFSNLVSEITLTNIDLETAKKVYQIYQTNAFHNGVCLKMSRFNHSCSSNAEYFWNTDEQTRDLRAIRNIPAGDEITVNYRGVEIQDVNDRIQLLLKEYHFYCNCAACDISEEESMNEIENCQKYKQLEDQRTALEDAQDPDDVFMHINIKQEVECLKEMYSVAKELKILRMGTIIERILEPGFDASCQGFYNMSLLNLSLPEKAQFMKDANNFASVGLQLSTLVNGAQHSTSLEWQNRKENPIEFFKEEQNVARNRKGLKTIG